MELEVVEVGTGRFQVIDRRGALVHAAGSRDEAEGVKLGYRIGREDAGRIVRNALEPLPERVRMDRG